MSPTLAYIQAVLAVLASAVFLTTGDHQAATWAGLCAYWSLMAGLARRAA